MQNEIMTKDTTNAEYFAWGNIWFFLSGQGQMWRKSGDHEEIVQVEAGVCLMIPLGTHLQFRSFGDEPLAAVGVTMPP